MPSSTSGSFNTACGFEARGQSVSARDGLGTTGNYNTAIGERALPSVTTGSYNLSLGAQNASQVNTANNVICVGAGVPGISSVVGEVDNSCYIGNIYNAPVDLNTAVPVLVDQDGKLGTQGFDAKKAALNRLPGIYPHDMFNESYKNDRKIDEQQSRIAALEAKVATQQREIERQHGQLDLLSAQLKRQVAAMERLTAETKVSQRAARNVVEK